VTLAKVFFFSTPNTKYMLYKHIYIEVRMLKKTAALVIILLLSDIIGISAAMPFIADNISQIRQHIVITATHDARNTFLGELFCRHFAITNSIKQQFIPAYNRADSILPVIPI